MATVHMHVHFRLDFIMEANNVNPQEQCWQYRLPKSITTTKIETGEKMVKCIMFETLNVISSPGFNLKFVPSPRQYSVMLYGTTCFCGLSSVQWYY